jgi:hypothetical protein
VEETDKMHLMGRISTGIRLDSASQSKGPLSGQILSHQESTAFDALVATASAHAAAARMSLAKWNQLATLVTIALLLILVPQTAPGQEEYAPSPTPNPDSSQPVYDPAPEYDVKANMLLHFTRYVKWPAETFSGPDSPVVIGILGHDPFGDIIDETVAGRTSDGRPVKISRFRSINDVKDCHLLFISYYERRRQKTYLSRLAGQPVLTVGESDGFLEAGGGINLLIVKDRVKFEVNRRDTLKVGIRVSSRMLQLAVNKDEL